MDPKALTLLGEMVLIVKEDDRFTVECNQCSQGDYLFADGRILDFSLSGGVLVKAWEHILRHHHRFLDALGPTEAEEQEAIASIAKTFRQSEH